MKWFYAVGLVILFLCLGVLRAEPELAQNQAVEAKESVEDIIEADPQQVTETPSAVGSELGDSEEPPATPVPLPLALKVPPTTKPMAQSPKPSASAGDDSDEDYEDEDGDADDEPLEKPETIKPRADLVDLAAQAKDGAEKLTLLGEAATAGNDDAMYQLGLIFMVSSSLSFFLGLYTPFPYLERVVFVCPFFLSSDLHFSLLGRRAGPAQL